MFPGVFSHAEIRERRASSKATLAVTTITRISRRKESRPRVSIFLSLTTRQPAPFVPALPILFPEEETPPLARADETVTGSGRAGYPTEVARVNPCGSRGETAFYRLLTHFYPCFVPSRPGRGPAEGRIRKRRRDKKRKEKKENDGETCARGISSRVCISSPLECPRNLLPFPLPLSLSLSLFPCLLPFCDITLSAFLDFPGRTRAGSGGHATCDRLLDDEGGKRGRIKKREISPGATLDLTPEKNRARPRPESSQSISGVNRFPCEI